MLILLLHISCICPEAGELVIACKYTVLHKGSNHFTVKYNILPTPTHLCHVIGATEYEMVHRFSMTFNLVKCFNCVLTFNALEM